MTILWSNNASSTVSGSITATSTSVQVASGQGALFPNPNPGDYFCVTFYDQATKTLNEICHCTARVGDILTIVRAQEGTPAQAWAAGDIIANLVTAGTLAAFVQAGTGPINTSLVYVGLDTGTPNHIIATTVPSFSSLATGMLINIKVKAGNSNTGPVDMQLNSLPAIRCSRTDGSDMVGGNLTGDEEMIFVYNGVDFTSMVPPIPQAPPQNIFYVRPDGNDNNDGFADTPTHAFRTVSGAMSAIENRYISQVTITVKVGDGMYVDAPTETTSYIASWYVVGNSTNPGNCVINSTSIVHSAYPVNSKCGIASSFSTINSGNVVIEGFTFQSYLANVAAGAGSTLIVRNCNFTAPVGGTEGAISAFYGSLSVYGTCQYSAAGPAVSLVESSGAGASVTFGYDDGITQIPLTFNFSGTPSFTLGTVLTEAVGVYGVANSQVAFTGVIPTGPAYRVQSGGGIYTGNGDLTIIPGTAPGVVIPPGWTQ